MQHKAGIYVRVSTEEQANVVEGSIESQQHRIREFVKSKNSQMGKWASVVDVYIDDGYSAKDTKRPQYQRMLNDMRSGRINLILVTEISRLSRNTYDFSSLLRELEKYRSKFLSVKEQFDTSTPAGEMMVYLMANLAQFERKQTSERVALNFHSRAMRGLRNGSRIILGYDPVDGNPGKYCVNEEEAVSVRKIFDTYLETGSLRSTTEILNRTNVCQKKGHYRLKHWTMENVHALLCNLSYVGKREVNKGYKNVDQESLQPWRKYQVVPACWPPIVSEEIFSLVQNGLNKNKEQDRERRSKQVTRTFLLSGILKCKSCGKALIGKSAHGKWGVHRYYDHKDTPGIPITCEIQRVRADKLEEAVLNHLTKILLDACHLDDVEENIRSSFSGSLSDLATRRDQVARQLSDLDLQIDNLFEFQISAKKDSASNEIVQDKLESLALKKKNLIQEKIEISQLLEESKSASETRANIENRAAALKKGWKKATPSMQKRLLRQLVESATFTSEVLEVRYITDKALTSIIHHSETKKPSELPSGGLSKLLKLHQNSKSHPAGKVSSSLLPSVDSGGGDPNLLEPGPLTSKVTIAALWKKEQIDLAELARLRWVEKWKYERLADFFEIGRTSVRDCIRTIKGNPSLAGLKEKPPVIRGG